MTLSPRTEDDSPACQRILPANSDVDSNATHSYRDTDLAELQRQCDTLRSQLKDSEKTRRDLDKRSKEEVRLSAHQREYGRRVALTERGTMLMLFTRNTGVSLRKRANQLARDRKES